MRCVKPCGSTVPASVTSFSKSANACRVHSAGESMDELTIAFSCRNESPISQTVRARFSKSHRKVEQMQEQIDALSAGLQKVRAQLDLRMSGPQTVLNAQ